MVATIVRRDATVATTVDNTTFTSASFTPTVGDLLVVCIRVTGTIGSAPVLTASANSITFGTSGSPLINQFTNASAHKDIVFVANQFVPSSPSAMTVTVVLTSGDTASGCIMGVFAVTGMTLAGTSAVRQFVAPDNTPSVSAAPASVTLPAAALTTNPLLGFSGTISTGGMTPPTGWTELLDQSYSTPTTGGEVAVINSGFTGTTVTTGSNSTVGGWAVIEFDASAPTTLIHPKAASPVAIIRASTF